MADRGVREVTVALDPDGPLAAAAPVASAIDRLRAHLETRGTRVRMLERREDATGQAPAILLAGVYDPVARSSVEGSGLSAPIEPESFALVPLPSSGEPEVLLCGADGRGLAYAALEFADRVEHAADLREVFAPVPEVERPANRVRSVARLFCSEVEDKAWFHDEGFWDRYLSMLIAQRFNRFSLTLGLGYNYHRNVTDAYLYFAYPFLLSVPGYDVRVPQLPEAERERNLEMIRFIAERAAIHGLDLQLGLWTHAYEWIDSPDAHHTIEGLTPETHAPYCRDAVRMLLQECPGIGGLTFRIHGESGVPEGSYDFWRTVFEGVATCGRAVGIDLHAKGLGEPIVSMALDTGQPVTVSPKFWAEHMGLPYHQAAIRERERVPREDPRERSQWHRYMSVSEGSRPFTRYGYGDFLREDRRYDVVFRLWAGTQRLLLWGDPEFAAAYGRAGGFAGGQGLEWCEPLTFKGREGTGVEGSRTGYADPTLVPRDDWEKYAYTYRLFGRLSYDPAASPETWRRYLRTDLGSAARPAEAALASASRILPLVTTAHHPSASNNYYWPEVYTDMPIVWHRAQRQTHPYLDTPEPRRFGTVSALDPETFSSVEDFVDEMLSGEDSGRWSPLDVARRLEELSREAADALGWMSTASDEAAPPHLRRLISDVVIQGALGRFFGGKIRAAVLYEFSTRTGSRQLLREAVDAYRDARAAWELAAREGSGVYVDDLTFGPQPYLRGHWGDRSRMIDRDIEEMERLLRRPFSGREMPEGEPRRFLVEAADRRPSTRLSHHPPAAYRRGDPVPLFLTLVDPELGGLSEARVRYRHLDQSRAYVDIEMVEQGDRWVATILGGDTDAPYTIQYFFVVRDRRGVAWRHPGLGEGWSSQPYLVVHPQGERPGGRPDRKGRADPPELRKGTARGGTFTGGPGNDTMSEPIPEEEASEGGVRVEGIEARRRVGREPRDRSGRWFR